MTKKKSSESKYCTYVVIYHHPESPICLEGPESKLHLYLDFIWTWSISGLYSSTQKWDLITQFIKIYTYKPEKKYIDLIYFLKGDVSFCYHKYLHILLRKLHSIPSVKILGNSN